MEVRVRWSVLDVRVRQNSGVSQGEVKPKAACTLVVKGSDSAALSDKAVRVMTHWTWDNRSDKRQWLCSVH